jgi:hypothetical protein
VEDLSEAVWMEVVFTSVFIDVIEGALRMMVGVACLELDSAGEYTVELCSS